MKIRRQRKFRRKSARRSTPARPLRLADGTTRDAKRDATTGRFGAGNSIARKADGINRAQKKGVFPAEIRAAVEAFTAQVEADHGGVADLAAIHQGYIRNLGNVDGLVRLAADDIRKFGVFTNKGHTRRVVFTFLQFLDRWDRYAQRLGLDRRTKPVTDIALALRDAEPRR